MVPRLHVHETSYSNKNDQKSLLKKKLNNFFLELVARSLEQKRNQHFTLSQCSWKSVTTSIKQFIAKIAERKGIKLIVFIDVNSSFTILTEIGLTAAEKIIIPITEDMLHRNGFEYMFALLYGFSHPSSAYFYYRHLSFYKWMLKRKEEDHLFLCFFYKIYFILP